MLTDYSLTIYFKLSRSLVINVGIKNQVNVLKS